MQYKSEGMVLCRILAVDDAVAMQAPLQGLAARPPALAAGSSSSSSTATATVLTLYIEGPCIEKEKSDPNQVLFSSPVSKIKYYAAISSFK